MTVVWFFCSLFWKVFIRHHLQDSRSNLVKWPNLALAKSPSVLSNMSLTCGSGRSTAPVYRPAGNRLGSARSPQIPETSPFPPWASEPHHKGVWKHGLSNASHMDEEMTYIKGPGAVSVGGVVVREEGCLQRPLHPQDCPKLNSRAADWTNVKTAFKHKWSNSFKSTVTTKHRHGWS